MVASKYTHRWVRAPRSAKTFDGRDARLLPFRYLMYVAEAVATGG